MIIFMQGLVHALDQQPERDPQVCSLIFQRPSDAAQQSA
jgi:hypothetical protein